ncbi:MAG: hypothetical protein KDD69_13480 [Bdellovibrionales bacterium]|nr:hypothetical protein [Bdellovibrionales bacterium]
MNAQPSPLSAGETRELYAFGTTLIEECRALVLELWEQNSYESELKSDKSPVTQVDIRAEELLRARINERYPDHGILGEEFGTTNTDSDYCWTIDPIDGTDNLVRRIPTFGTMLGLSYKQVPVLGYLDHPALGFCLSGGKGLGVTRNGVPLPKLPPVPQGAAIELETVGISTPLMAARNGSLGMFDTVVHTFRNSRMYYDCYGHSLALLGGLSAMVELNLRLWDMLPISALMAEVGGLWVPLPRSELDLEKGYCHAVFGRPEVVRAVLRALGVAEGE